jgi:hypothetical protein
MASLTANEAVRSGSADLTFEAGAASQEIDLEAPDRKYVLIVRNDDAVTAMIAIEAGSYSGAALGDLEKTVAQNGYAILGPVEGWRFKDSSAQLSVLITDDDGTVFSGTVSNVKLCLVQLP